MSNVQPFKAYVLAFCLGVLGALANLFPIELAFNISLLIGNVAYILAASYLRPAQTLLCALVCVTPLYFYWGHPYGFVTFGLEALFISWLRTKGWFVIAADLVYWLIIGMPLTAIFIWINLESVQSYILFSTFKQAINAVLYTSLASILLFTFNRYLTCIKSYQPPLVKGLPHWLRYSFWSISAFLVISVSLVLSTGFGDFQRKQLDKELLINNNYVAYIGNRYLDEHKRAIANISFQLSQNVNNQQAHEALAALHELYPGFLTMLIANEQGNIELASPAKVMSGLAGKHLSIKDRDYFIHAMEQQQLYVSPVFLGRGFGSDPIVAISAPFYSLENPNSPIGIVEGSLNVNQFGMYDIDGHDNNEAKIVVTDQNDRVIYASSMLNLLPLSTFTYKELSTNNSSNLLSIDFAEAGTKRFIYKQTSFANNWKVYSLVEHSVLLQLTENMYLLIFVMLFVVLLTASFFAKQFASHLYRPLAFVMGELSKTGGAGNFKNIPYETPIEIEQLYRELKVRSQALFENKTQLQELVEQRTQALNDANRKLTEQANKDTLTKLYNRRYFNKHFTLIQSILSRSDAKLMCAMVDLDYFKKINDSYGHLFGDYCLVEIANMLKQYFNRETDIVARFGGEEFVIVFPCSDIDAVIARLESFREKVEEFCFINQSDKCIPLTVSIGAVFGEATYSMNQDDWLARADECLYKAKNSGRNNIQVHTIQTAKVTRKPMNTESTY